MVAVVAESLLGEVAQALIARLNAELEVQYPEEGANHFRLDPDEVAPGRGLFLVARDGGVPIGCGAFRKIDDTTAELKRMFVDPAARGRGVGVALLAALEREAAALGVTRVVLETGLRQTNALALYTRAGYEPIPAFGEYVNSPLSLCMGKTLATPAT
jgi:GNAT superfamily N-acetyltransferase